jgi:hypothetical protein
MTTKASRIKIALIAAVTVGLTALGASGPWNGVVDADAAEPRAVQVLAARTAPRAGQTFLGVAVATLEEGARLYRSVTPVCTRGRIRVGPNRTLSVPVDIARLPHNPQEGGSVRSVTTCTWHVPPVVRGRTLAASVVVRIVNLDGTTARSGQTVEWSVR